MYFTKSIKYNFYFIVHGFSSGAYEIIDFKRDVSGFQHKLHTYKICLSCTLCLAHLVLLSTFK